jgi:hypothetical protein
LDRFLLGSLKGSLILDFDAPGRRSTSHKSDLLSLDLLHMRTAGFGTEQQLFERSGDFLLLGVQLPSRRDTLGAPDPFPDTNDFNKSRRLLRG